MSATTGMIAYPEKSRTSILPITTRQELIETSIQNDSGGPIRLALLRKMANRDWKLGEFDGSAIVDKTVEAQGAGTFNLLDTTPGHGVIVQSIIKPSLWGFNVTIDGGADTLFFNYFDGSTFVTLPTLDAPASFIVDENVILFLIPDDIQKAGSGGAGIGADADKYPIQIISNMAPAGNVVADEAWAGIMLRKWEAVADADFREFKPTKPVMILDGEGIMPFFGTADGLNSVALQYNGR